MANADTRGGLTPIRVGLAAPFSGAFTQPYYVSSGYGTALYVGDPVIVMGTANTAAVGNFPIGTLRQINRATAASGNYLSGAIVGFGPDRDNLSLQYNPASTERIVFVADDPATIFEMQEDDSGTALSAASAGLNCDFVITHSGSTVTGVSGVELDRSTAASTNTLQLRLIRYVNRQDNEVGDWAKWEVQINLNTAAGLRYATGI